MENGDKKKDQMENGEKKKDDMEKVDKKKEDMENGDRMENMKEDMMDEKDNYNKVRAKNQESKRT